MPNNPAHWDGAESASPSAPVKGGHARSETSDSAPAISPKGNDLWAAWNRCPICEGIDQPGLLHNPEAPYCSEADPAKERFVSDSSPHSEPFALSAADRVEIVREIVRRTLRKAAGIDIYKLLNDEMRDAEEQLDGLLEQLQTLQGADREWAAENEALAIDLNAEHVKVFELQEQLEAAERWLRFEWWCNHGHPYEALYGDDQEMQCGMCPMDFKREPLSDLHLHVITSRAALNPAKRPS